MINLTLSQFILRLVIHGAYSCIFHPCSLLPHFPLLHFPPLHYARAAFSTPAFSVAPSGRLRSHETEDRFLGLADASFSTPLVQVGFLVSPMIWTESTFVVAERNLHAQWYVKYIRRPLRNLLVNSLFHCLKTKWKRTETLSSWRVRELINMGSGRLESCGQGGDKEAKPLEAVYSR